MPRLRESDRDRFIRQVEIYVGGCWLWKGYVSKRGYGNFSVKHRPQLAHRYSYELFKAPIPEGLQIDHLCRVRHCVNPNHLEAVTCRENLVRGQGNTAFNANRTHCIHGHPFEGENLYVTPDGRRQCKECNRRRNRQRG